MSGGLRRFAAILVVATVVAACGGRVDAYSGPTPGPNAMPVVASTTFLADMVRQVGGTHVSVHSLVPRGGDVHTYDPRPSDAMRLSQARLVFMNGLGLDDWLARLASNVSSGTPIVRLGQDLPGVSYISAGGVVNPHLWLDVTNAELYADRIASALANADPPNAAAYADAAAAYRADLAALDSWARSSLGALPVDSRRIVSFHDALPYFARAYGLLVVGNVIPAPGQEPSAAEVTKLVQAIRAAHVRAIFSEVQFNPGLARTIAQDAGATVVSNLYTDTLGDPPVDTFEGMVRWDVERVLEALR